MTTDPRAGWYPDPAGRPDTYRWWDGGRWTDETSDVPNAPAPPASALGGSPVRPHSTGRRLVALVLVAALFASAGVGVGLWLWRDGAAPSRDLAAGGAPAPRSTASAPSGRLDEQTRTATIGSATMQLPDSPYVVHDDPVGVHGLLGAAFLAEAEVHTDYQGWHDWSAMVALAWVDPELTRSEKLRDGAAATLPRIAATLYGDHPTEVSDLSTADQAVDGRPGVLVTATVHYDIDGLPSRYDTVTAHLVKLEDGTVVAALSSVPDDADQTVVATAAASLASLRVG